MELDLAQFRDILEKAKAPRPDQPYAKKSRSVDRTSVWDQLEKLYEDMEKKEQDYQTALTIGQRLLQKNQELLEQNGRITEHFNQVLRERDLEISRVASSANDDLSSRSEIKLQMDQLNMQLSLTKKARTESDKRVEELTEEYQKIEKNLNDYRKKLKNSEEKCKTLIEETERYKEQLGSGRKGSWDQGAFLDKVKGRSVGARLRNSSSMDPLNDDAIAKPTFTVEDVEQLKADIKLLKQQKIKMESVISSLDEENAKMHETMFQKEEECETLRANVEALVQTVQMLRQQQIEERQILEEKSGTINALKSALEEKHHKDSDGIISEPYRDPPMMVALDEEEEIEEEEEEPPAPPKRSRFSILLGVLCPCCKPEVPKQELPKKVVKKKKTQKKKAIQMREMR